MTSRYSKRLRAAVSAGTALTLAAIGLAAPAANAAATHAISGATMTWEMNPETGAGAFLPGACNFLVAGEVADAGGAAVWSQEFLAANYKATDGNVSIIKAGPDNTWVTPTLETYCKDANGDQVNTGARQSHNRVVYQNGTGEYDAATGAGSIEWTGSYTIVFYSGYTYWSVSDPRLEVEADGSAQLFGTASGFGTSMEDMDIWEPLPREEIVLADLEGIDLDASGAVVTTPKYRGVTVTGVDPAQVTTGANAGSFPQSFVNYQKRTGQTSYWYSSGGSADVRKVPAANSLEFSYESGPLAVVTTHPANASVEEGKQATFTVAASNPDPDEALTYAWESSTNGETWTAVNGATRASYAVIGRASASGTQYRVKVKNQNGTVTSSAATLTVTAADLDPTVTLSADEFVSDAESVVTVTGTGFDPNYVLGTRPPLAGTSSGVYVAFGKFAENWKPSTGAAGSTRPTADVRWSVLAQDMATIGGEENGAGELRPDGTFELTLTVDRATADNAAAAVASGNYGIYTYPGGGGWQPAFETFTPITFQPLVDITEQPAQRTVAAGGPATFAVAYDSASDASVQWQVSTDDGKTWQDIAGANSAEYKIDQVATSLNGNLYRAKFVNSGGTEYSDSALLVVRIPGLTITGQPAAATSLAVGDSTALAVSASGQFVTYQWQVRAPGTTAWTNVAGATSQRLTVAPTAVAQSGTSYRVVLANPAGEQISATAAVTVTKAASKLNAKLGKKKAKAKKRVKVRATLKTKAANAGKVRVVFKGTKGKAKGKKTTRTVAVKANGKVTVKSAKLRKGKYKVTARYLGTADVSAVKAKKIGTVKVR